MNLLIDTHLLLCAAYAPERLSKAARQRFLDPANRLHFSVVSLWEVAIKRGLNRPDFAIDPGPLRAGLLASDYTELPIEGRQILGLATLPQHHADPFDRLLIAQASAEGMALLSADAAVARYGGPVIAA